MSLLPVVLLERFVLMRPIFYMTPFDNKTKISFAVHLLYNLKIENQKIIVRDKHGGKIIFEN